MKHFRMALWAFFAVVVATCSAPNMALAQVGSITVPVYLEQSTGNTKQGIGTLGLGAGTTAQQVQGNSASGATVIGNPVSIGVQAAGNSNQFVGAANNGNATGNNILAAGSFGVFNTTPPTLTSGQYGNVQMSNGGGLGLATFNGSTWVNLSSINAAPLSGQNSPSVGLVSPYNVTLPTYTDGQFGALHIDVNGNLRTLITGPSTAVLSNLTNSTGLLTASASVTGVPLGVRAMLYNGVGSDVQASILAALALGNTGLGTDAVENAGVKFNEITTATTTLVNSGGSILHTVNVNTCVASATIKIYNALTATGTPLTLTCPVTLGNPFQITYDFYFSTGITVVTSGATDVAIGYR